MIKLVKLLLGFTMLLVVIVAIVLVGAVLFFDPNQHKDFIVSQVEKNTGREFTLAGNINLSYYPWLGVEAEGVTLGNAKGFGDEPFLHVDAIALRIKTMPLLSKKYELDTLKLQGLKLNLAKNEDGISNWDDLTGKQVADQAPQKAREPFQLAAVILGGVDVKNALITWSDQSTGQKIVVSNLNATTGELTYGDPINLAIDLKAEVNKPSLSSHIKMKGVLNYNLDTEIYAFKPIDLLATITGKDVPGGTTDLVFKAAMETNLDAETFTVSGLSLDVLGTSIRGDLAANNIKSGEPSTEAKLTIKSDDLAKLFQLVDPKVASELAKLADRSMDMKLSLESDLQQDLVRVSDMDIKVLGAIIQGQVEANNLKSDKPAVKGKLKATGPDLPAIMQIVGQFEAGDDPKLKNLGQQLAKVKDKSFNVAAEFDANLEQGNILVPNFSVNTLGITANGQLDAKQMNSTSPKVDGKFSLKGEKLAGLLTALDKKELGKVLQVITIGTDISSAGGDIALSPLQVKATLAGKQIPNSPAEIALNADTRINLEKQTLVMNNMTLKGLGLDVAGNINASKIMGGSPALSGNLNAKGSDLALLFKLAGVEPLASQLTSISDRSFNVKAKLNVDMGKGHVKVSDLDAKLVGASIKGHVDARNIQSDMPAVKGSLNATGPDLPTLMQIAGKFSGPDSGLTEMGKKLGKAPNKAFNITTEFDTDFNAGNIDLPALDIKALGLTIKGNMKARGLDKKNGTIDGVFSLKGEKIAAVLNALGQGGLGEVMQSISIDAGIKGNQNNIALSPFKAKAMFAGKQIPNSPVAITLNTQSASASLNNQTLTIKQLVINGLGLNLTANINAIQILKEPKFNGDLTIAEFNLRDFAKKLNQKLPNTADKSVLQKVGMKTTFSGSKENLSLNDLSVRLDNSQLDGNFSVKHFTQPRFQFDIGIDSINVDRYLPPDAKAKNNQKKKKKQKKPVTPETAAAAAATELPIEMLRTLNMKGDLFIGQFVLSNVKLKKVKIDKILAKEGDISLAATANLYQGKYQGTVKMDAKGKLPKLNVNTTLQGVQLEPLIKDYTRAPSQLAGVANITAQLNSKGNSPEQLKKALNGKADLRVTNGVLRGIDIRKTIETAEIIIEDKRFDMIGNVKQGGETRFDKLTATLQINKGVVTNKDLLMLAPGFRVRGHGTIANLHNNTLKYTLIAAVDETSATRGSERYNIGGYEIPVRCQGKLENISSACKPDMGEIAKVAIKKGFLDKLGDELGVKLPTSGTGQTQKQPTGDTTTTKDEDPVKKILEEFKIKF